MFLDIDKRWEYIVAKGYDAKPMNRYSAVIIAIYVLCTLLSAFVLIHIMILAGSLGVTRYHFAALSVLIVFALLMIFGKAK